ncbi:alpha/beta fold hydrolase [Paenibacillus doosanensis]|uniref:alpha/beta fold hydrolase n=1 Tax=Paenibacillus doosanensis TaxID=1229154 RepID=UPI0021801F35|nr:alpha/beta hydrolase [Paenibacillus doosanensis]MCS7460371.1 alpha/beta fold hydrolase [Paenibacillus doosanensis]
MSYINLDDRRIYYGIHESKVRDTDTLLLVHGMGLDSTLWERITPLLQQHYRVVVCDLRGHGQSDDFAAKPTFEGFIQDLEAIVTALELKDIHIVAHGLGTNLSAKFASEFPHVVKSMIFIGATFVVPKPVRERGTEFRKKLSTDGSLVPLGKEIAKHITLEPENSPEVNKIIRCYSRTTYDCYFGILELYSAVEQLQLVSNVNQPILFIAGQKDLLYPPSTIEIASNCAPNGIFRIINDSSNMTFIDQPESTATLIYDFISNPEIMIDSESPPFWQGLTKEISSLFYQATVKLESTISLRVDLINSFRVYINGEEHTNGWNQRYAKNILVYLTFHPTCTREQICDALFPAIPLKTVLRNLKVYLNYLKKLLAIPLTDSSILNTDKEHIMLNCNLRSDIIELIETIRTVDIQENDPLRYVEATKLMGKIPETNFLPGVYDDWFIEIKERTMSRIADIAIWLGEKEKLNGEYSRAIRFYDTARRYKPSDESVYDKLIDLYRILQSEHRLV